MDLARSVSCSAYTRNSDCWREKWENSAVCVGFWRNQEMRCDQRRNGGAFRMIRKDSEVRARMKLLVVNASDGGAETETAVVEKPSLRGLEVSAGSPMPFGATLRDGGVNFAICSGNSASATLCLMSLSDLQYIQGRMECKTAFM